MNKKAAKLLSVWWFFVLVVIATGIVVGVLMYHGKDIDAREVEARILAEKILNCLNQQGFLHENFLKTDFDLFKECGLSKEVFAGENFYFNVSVYNKDKKILGNETSGGKGSFEGYCELLLGSKARAEYYPKCVQKSEGILYYDKTIARGSIVVLAASNQFGKRSTIK